MTGRQWSRSPSSDDSSLPTTRRGGAGDARDRAQLAQQIAVALEPGVAIARRQRAAPLARAGRRQADDREERHLQAVALGGARHLGQRGQRRRISACAARCRASSRRSGTAGRPARRAWRRRATISASSGPYEKLTSSANSPSATPRCRSIGRGRGGGGDGNVPSAAAPSCPARAGGRARAVAPAARTPAAPARAARPTRIMTRAPAAPRAPAPP